MDLPAPNAIVDIHSIIQRVWIQFKREFDPLFRKRQIDETLIFYLVFYLVFYGVVMKVAC